MTAQDPGPDISMNADDLYREDMFSDRRAGSIRRLTPVTAEGQDDPDRAVLYIGQAQLLTPMGALPLNFEIEADSLADAVSRFGDAAKVAVDQAMDELKELRREAASSIVLPESGAGIGGGGMGGGGLGGGLGGGGNIQMP